MNDPHFLQQLLDAPLQTVATYYANCLAGNRRAIEFIVEHRKLTPEQAASQNLGFADRTLGKQIPSRRVNLGRKVRDRLVECGLYKPNGRETLRGRVTEPVLDDEGNLIGLRGYKIDAAAEGESVIECGIGFQPVKTDVCGIGFQSVKTDEPAAESAAVQEPSETPAEPNEPTEPHVNDSSDLTIADDSLHFTRDDRHYRVRGLEKNRSACTLKVNLMVSRDSLVHLDSLDLVKARSRASFIKAAATELYVDAGIIKKDIGQLLLKLETHQAQRIAELKAPQKPAAVTLSDEDRAAALELLRAPNLLERIVTDMDACGIVGESTNKLAGYLAATSRKLAKPLAVVIQSSSSAGKTSLMDAVLSMMPSEDVQRFSGMTGQSLFYLNSDQIRHKILAIAEDEGIQQATYALKLLQSEGQLRHATVGRGENGRSQTQEHHVQGPVQIFLTTTAMDIDEELVNRCFVLSVDETKNQTNAIQLKQRETFTNEFTHAMSFADSLRTLHQNAQRLLRPLDVFNPYAPQLTFPDHKTRMRRDHIKYLTLIHTITFLHQHQRTIHQATHAGKADEYINVEPCDIAVANGLAGEVLGRSLDELSPQTRALLGKLHEHVDVETQVQGVPRNAYRFTRRDVRESIHWSDSQIRKHLSRLVELEYVLVHRGRNGQRYVYELLYSGEGQEGQPFLMGLIDPAKLKSPASMTQTLPPSAPTLTP
ncbi:hypothetical protein [Roseimaritima sediminicola]|uniref:hypothetical protein n=1 Tax=Roseimaritima sediminicola TaxID=2662066 RepID=UPI00129839DF|nr:hypothetical protein [Roseimaritima sediminicola]